MGSTTARSAPAAGALLLVLGGAIVILAFLPGTNLHDAGVDLLPGDGEVLLQAGAGVVLVLTGLVALRLPDAGGTEPRDMAQLVEELEPLEEDEPASAPGDGGMDTMEHLTERDIEMTDLDRQIKEVTRRINQARVKLGTGKLSHEGYKRIAEELEAKRAELEQRRVELELEDH